MTTIKNDGSTFCKKIFKLKKNLNPVILAHNCQRPEVQNIADLTVPSPSQEALSRLYPSGK